MNSRKLAMGLLTGALLVAAAPGVSAIDFNFEKTESSSSSRIVTDIMGNEFEVTHVIETVNGETQEYYDNVPFVLHNNTDQELTEVYVANIINDSWGDNALTFFGEGTTLNAQEGIYGLYFQYYVEHPFFETKMVLADGTELKFNRINLYQLENPNSIDLTLDVNDEGEYIMIFGETGEDGEEVVRNVTQLIPVTWDMYQDAAPEGGFYSEELVNLMYFVPDFMSEVELNEEDKEAGFIRYYVGDNGESLNIHITEDETIRSIEDYEELLRDEYGMETSILMINNLTCVMYYAAEVPEGEESTLSIAFATSGGGKTVEFNYAPADSDTEFGSDIIPVMIGSIQLME